MTFREELKSRNFSKLRNRVGPLPPWSLLLLKLRC